MRVWFRQWTGLVTRGCVRFRQWAGLVTRLPIDGEFHKSVPLPTGRQETHCEGRAHHHRGCRHAAEATLGHVTRTCGEASAPS